MRGGFFKMEGWGAESWINGDVNPIGTDSAVHGMLSPEKVDGKLQLQRAGPVVPLFSLPLWSPLIVTDDGKSLLSESGFAGLSFREVDYANVVDIDWHTWDTDDGIPDDAIPIRHNYDFCCLILDPAEHRPDLVSTMPPVFEVVTALTLKLDYPDVEFRNYKNQELVNVVSDGTIRFPMVSEKGKQWFLQHGDWLHFTEVKAKQSE